MAHQIITVSTPLKTIKRHSKDHAWTYRILDLFQRQVAEEIRQGKPGRIILSELAPVITLGRTQTILDLEVNPSPDLSLDLARRMGVSVVETNRGGKATYHGPGQWVLFVVESLEKLTGNSMGVRPAVKGLLEIAQSTLGFGDIRWGNETGLWGTKGKLASVGVAIRNGILLHGVAINIFRTPLSFAGLSRPCGLDAGPEFYLPEPDEAEFINIGNKILNHRYLVPNPGHAAAFKDDRVVDPASLDNYIK